MMDYICEIAEKVCTEIQKEYRMYMVKRKIRKFKKEAINMVSDMMDTVNEIISR